MVKPSAHRGSEQRGRTLLVYASAQDRTAVIAQAIAARLRAHGFVAEVGDADCGVMPPPEDYDGVILGVPARFGAETRLIADYIHHNRRGLAEVPAALFTVSTSGSVQDDDPGGFLEPFLRDVRWHPDLAAAFAGGEPFPQKGRLVRFARRLGYLPEQRPAPSLLASWIDVHAFADEVAKAVATAAVTAERTEPHVADH